MIRIIFLTMVIAFSHTVKADTSIDSRAIKRAVLDYIEAQQKVDPNLMRRGLDVTLAKRTYWESKEGTEYILETDFDTMIKVAETYNIDGKKFPKKPKIEINVFDIDNRVASVKLTVDDWIDYMHLYKTDDHQWKIINVLWQYNDIKKHSSKR